MVTAAERERLKTEYLGLAGQAERLRRTAPSSHVIRPEALERFQNLYGSNLDMTVHGRDE